MLALMVPGLAFFLVFFYVPMLGNVIAFQDYQPFIGFQDSPFVGFANLQELFADPAFWEAVRNTLVFALLQLLLFFPAPLALALLVNSLISGRTRRFVQSIVYLPHFISWVLVVALFQQVLGGAGLLNNFLREHGMQPWDLMTNPDTFPLLITGQAIWKDVGWGMIIYLAALASVDQSLYESAAVDGAGRWRRMWHITLPAVRSVTILLLVLRLGDILSVGFEQFLLQRDAVGARAAEVLDTYVFYHGVVYGDWGIGAAAGLVKGVVGALMIWGANKVAHAFGEQGVYSK
ncbi:polysaccharide ABC transporter ATP-binding protein [Streptomyces spiroverticillatus]|uniref:Polysaccharide ABC transporter ATP-binding protein n=2 Tax=Streptomyces finlayi TaxID=67296 RepID=A0A919CCS0_9ACTN|nr:polysaccharide ABC transporter ATP-binding protein [Streptomyces spiroverticillatus]GHD07902.1 polysaccharide ABC transporter ATP-binding protein [Streptomyces finlayi]